MDVEEYLLRTEQTGDFNGFQSIRSWSAFIEQTPFGRRGDQ
jgi:hypothetical protein